MIYDVYETAMFAALSGNVEKVCVYYSTCMPH